MDKALLVASSYVLGVLLNSAVHEFGHILAYWSIGFTQFSLYIDPFASSNVTPLETLPPERMVFLASSGMAFQFIICLFSWWILRTRNNALLVPLRFGAPMGILNIGSYLWANSIVDGDSWLLVQHRVPELVVNLGVYPSICSGLTFSFEALQC